MAVHDGMGLHWDEMAPGINNYEVIIIVRLCGDGFAVRTRSILLILSKWILALPLIRVCCFGYASALWYKYFMSDNCVAGYTSIDLN